MQFPEEDVRAFVGPNADYYLRAWTAVDPNAGPQMLRWNWPAFFLNIVWLLYRRMYKYFWMAVAAMFVIGSAEGVLQALLGIPPGPHWFDILINLAIAGFFGAFGNWFYYRHAAWTIAQTKARHTSPEAIARAGGVRWLWPCVILGAAVALWILAVTVFPRIVQTH